VRLAVNEDRPGLAIRDVRTSITKLLERAFVLVVIVGGTIVDFFVRADQGALSFIRPIRRVVPRGNAIASRDSRTKFAES
jgi:hypothetical protein